VFTPPSQEGKKEEFNVRGKNTTKNLEGVGRNRTEESGLLKFDFEEGGPGRKELKEREGRNAN